LFSFALVSFNELINGGSLNVVRSRETGFHRWAKLLERNLGVN